ncbi:uncharacterized protein LOC116336839 isoform X1 [Contarinia nasturtii]|uniref:uncharacterized protein LOC116336839 isoform X1 n=1 Tax=Contarinia nasturtii TaxID=265458 RepID=UPI0012D3CA71|nr:uncharacterized protein LOC116336839 isoform X1 [Contarinia nasturtii]XP_031616851.1 uncharacterized protein LOC116336839 isoform X1 [Contarinia nasturtii]
MKQLLRLLTALMLFFGLCHIVCAQRRGTMRFISSPDELSEWDSHKTVATSSDSISRADVLSHDNVQSTRRGRYRTTTTTTPPDDTLADFKTAKVPVYRVRGRNRSNKQDTENDKNLTESTTAATTIVKSNGESNNRTARRKQYQSNKQRTITRNENQSIETNNNSNKDAVSSTATHHATFSSRKHQTDLESTKSTTELPANHQPDNHRKTYSDTVNIRKQPTGRRYRIRTAEANAINANGQATESEKKVAAAAAINSATVSAVVSSTNDTKGKKTERNENGDDEQNYPEHFKALLKSKKTTVLPSSRINNVASKKQNILASTTSSTPEQSTTTLRPPYKHKKIERPNLKLLFPSLHTSSTTSESTPSTAPAAAAAAVTTINETDQMATTDELNTETNVPSDVPSTTVKSKTTVQKQISGVKFSSKIRTEGGDDSLAAFRSRSTSLVFDTKSSTSRTPNIKSDVPPTNHRFSAGPVLDTPKFSARYKSGEGALSLAAYRKNLMREKPPFYTPTTPPITTQVNEIDWAASDYSYHYNDVEPIRSGLMQNPPLNVETSHHSSSSVTVSIFGALSEILSHTTESLSFLTSTTTEYTPLSHTHSTFLSTNHDPAQIQKIQTDIPKIPSMTGDSTITTTTTTNAKINNDSNEFRLPILNAFDSNEAITSSSKPSSSHTTVVTSNNEQVDTKLTSSYTQISTTTQKPFSSSIATILKSDINDSRMHIDANKMHQQQHHHSNHSSNSDVMIVLASSDRSSMQSNNRTAHAIRTTHSEQPELKMQINTITESFLSLNNFTTQTNVAATLKTSNVSQHSNVIPIYPIYVSTTTTVPTTSSLSSMYVHQSFSTESPSTSNTSMTTTTTKTTIDRPKSITIPLSPVTTNSEMEMMTTTTTTTIADHSHNHTTMTTMSTENSMNSSAEQLGKYLQKANTSNIHSKSENVFSLAPPTSQLSDGSTNGFGLNGQYRPISLDDYDSLPSSNEVTSNESSSTTGNTESDPFSLSNEFDITQQQPTMTKATSPKSNREYITSFTTTTTTTQKPHIEKGVKIIRELVEQARTTEEPDTNRPIQSLTTVKTFVKEHRPVTTQKPKAPTSAPPVPANHRPTWAIESTSIRMKHPNHNFDGFDSTERYNNENAIKTSQRPTSTRTTTKINTTVKTTTRGNSITSATTRSPKTEKTKPTTTTTTTTSETELPIGINDIEDLLQSIPTTTRRAKPTTTTTTRTTTRATTTRSKQTTPAASDNDDLNFLRQVQRLLQRPTSTRKPIQTKSTTASTSVTSTTTNSDNGDNSTPKLEIYTVSKTKNENSSGGPTSTFDDLLNSFQKEAVTTTTRRPQLTTFSDADDIAFLKGLRQIAVDTSTPKTTRNPDFAKQIIAQFSLNQTSKVQPEKTNALNVDGYPQVPTIGRDEIEKNKNDVASLNTDLQLLSTLLGRPISQKDIPQLTKQASTLPPSISSTTLRTTTVRTTKPPVNPKIVQEIELLHQIAKKPDGIEPDNELTSTDELAAIDPSDAYGKTNDALLATLLKQRGIGPAHNNIPLNIYSTTTTMRPQYLSPARSPRPLIDGLSWLWKTWQDTAPGQGGYAPQSSRTRTRGTNSEIVTATDTDLSLDDGLDSDISSQPLDQSHTNGNSGFGFGSGLPGGGQLLSAALGVTRAVTQLLGSALQGAGKTIQSAWSTQAFGSASGGGGGDYFRLSG